MSPTRWPQSPFPTDARGLLILVTAILPVGLVLFFVAYATRSPVALLGFVALVIGSVVWLYRRTA